MKTDIKNSYLFEELQKLDLHYFIIITCMQLVNDAFELDKTKDLAAKLHLNFVSPIFNIVKNKMAPLLNDLDDFYFDDFYHSFSKEEHLKIEKFINNNIDVFEIVFAPVYEIIDRTKYINCRYYARRCCNDKPALHRVMVNYRRLENLKCIYLLQKCIKNNKCVPYNKLNLIKHRIAEFISDFYIKEHVYNISLSTNSQPQCNKTCLILDATE